MKIRIPWLAAPLVLVGLLLVPLPVRADTPERLIAYVFERPHGEQALVGASAGLEAAGFRVRPLPLRRAPDELDAHVIVFGSWLGEGEEYRPYMARHREALARYVERGGVVLHRRFSRRIACFALLASPPLARPRTRGPGPGQTLRSCCAGRCSRCAAPRLGLVPLATERPCAYGASRRRPARGGGRARCASR